MDQLCALLDPSLSEPEAECLIDEWCCRARKEGLEACETLQYDSAILPASQIGVHVGSEPFTEQQQKESKLDCGLEIDQSQRDCIEVTEPTQQWHAGRDARLADIESRPLLHPFKSLSLQGAAQSILPSYRDPSRFGRHIAIEREGLPDICFEDDAHHDLSLIHI